MLDRSGSAVIVDEQDGALVLRPAVVTPLRLYSDDEIKGWLREDRVTPATRVIRKATRR